MSDATVIITVNEYSELIHAANKLACLENAGVDNWDGYDMAMEALEEIEDSD